MPAQDRQAEKQRKSGVTTASLGREISDFSLECVLSAGEPGEGDEDLVNLTRGVQEGRLVRLTHGYALSIEGHVRQGIENTHERFIGLIGRVVKVDRESASCDGTYHALPHAPCGYALCLCAREGEFDTIPSVRKCRTKLTLVHIRSHLRRARQQHLFCRAGTVPACVCPAGFGPRDAGSVFTICRAAANAPWSRTVSCSLPPCPSGLFCDASSAPICKCRTA